MCQQVSISGPAGTTSAENLNSWLNTCRQVLWQRKTVWLLTTNGSGKTTWWLFKLLNITLSASNYAPSQSNDCYLHIKLYETLTTHIWRMMKGLARCSTKSFQFARQQLCNNRAGARWRGEKQKRTLAKCSCFLKQPYPRPKTNRQRVLSGLTTYKHKPARWFCRGRNPLLGKQQNKSIPKVHNTGSSCNAWEVLAALERSFVPFPSLLLDLECVA